MVCGIVLCVTWKCCRDLSTSEEPQEQGALTGPAQPFDTEVTLGARVNQWPAEGLLAGECLRARPSCVRQAPPPGWGVAEPMSARPPSL